MLCLACVLCVSCVCLVVCWGADRGAAVAYSGAAGRGGRGPGGRTTHQRRPPPAAGAGKHHTNPAHSPHPPSPPFQARARLGCTAPAACGTSRPPWASGSALRICRHDTARHGCGCTARVSCQPLLFAVCCVRPRRRVRACTYAQGRDGAALALPDPAIVAGCAAACVGARASPSRAAGSCRLVTWRPRVALRTWSTASPVLATPRWPKHRCGPVSVVVLTAGGGRGGGGRFLLARPHAYVVPCPRHRPHVQHPGQGKGLLCL